MLQNLRSKRPPEPFKGKGIKYSNEFIFRKEGKKIIGEIVGIKVRQLF